MKVILFESLDQNRLASRSLLNSMGIETIETGRLDKLSQLLNEDTRRDISGVVVGINRNNIENTLILKNIAKTLQKENLPYITLASTFDVNEAQDLTKSGLKNIIYRCSRASLLRNQIITLFSTDKEDISMTTENVATSIDNNQLSHIKVLLVDDNKINLKLAQTLLEIQGIEVVTAEDGLQAVELSGRQYFNLILMDLHMPKLNGFSAAKTIRNTDNPCNQTIIVALTANAMPDEQLQVFGSGMNDILLKPITEQQLLDVLTRWVKTENSNDNNKSETVNSMNNIFDKELSIQLAGGNEQLANELFPMLMSELPSHRENLLIAKQENDMRELKKHIHKLHGGTKYCGVPTLLKYSAEFENIIDLNELDKLDKGLENVISSIDELLEFYQGDYLNKLKAKPLE